MKDITHLFPAMPGHDVHRMPPSVDILQVSQGELDGARLSPTCIVDKHSYADVSLLIAPGGTGKTTLMLYESIHIALGLSLYGLRVMNPGWSLIITAEDRRDMLVARLREIGYAMNLSDTQWHVVMRSVCIWDVCGSSEKLTHVADGNIEMTGLIDRIAEVHEKYPPCVMIFDPLISFGASEQMVNDNEQQLITAGRKLVGALGCCVRFVHHTGKKNVGADGLHMYSGRGGSALSDGARAIMVLQAWSSGGVGMPKPPEACQALAMDTGASITMLARPKLSYAEPNLPIIWLVRNGFGFDSFVDFDEDEIISARAREAQVLTFLATQIAEDHFYSTRQLNVIYRRLNMTQAQLRVAVAELEATNRLVTVVVPKAFNASGMRRFLCPSHMSGNYQS